MGRPTLEVPHASSPRQDEEANVENIQQVLAAQADVTRIVFLHGAVTENSISSVIAQLLYLANINKNPIYLVVSTYGGSVDEMFSLYDIIKFLPCPVHTIGIGKVMSAGVLLLASGVKGKRLIGASSRIMIHPMAGGAGGNVFEIENEAKELRRMHELMSKLLSKETNMTIDEVNKIIMNPMLDYYLSPQRAIELGIVDKLIGDQHF